MLSIWIGMLGIGIRIISSIGIGGSIVSMMRGSCGMIIMLLMRIRMIRGMSRRRRMRHLVTIGCTVILGYNRRGGLGRKAFGGILLHLLIEPLLVILRHLLVLLLIGRGEGAPALAKDDAHVNEFDAGVLLHDLGTHVEGEEDKGSTGAFGLTGVLVFLHVLLVETAVLHEVSGGVVSGGRDVSGHLGLVASLVLGGVSLPAILLFEGEALVHVGGVFG
mmetsp:Transcript_36257/g.65286  ORF Transcript_36257/g.65286 Transcript_36257/m.65286 type:complete len:219 (-) Transcript_36257:881-1537(-)